MSYSINNTMSIGADLPGECLFSANELPPGRTIRITVTPRDCFDLAGKPMASTFVNVARDHGISGRVRAC